MVGPAMFDTQRFCQAAICQARLETAREPPPAVPVTELACFSLRFDVPPPPTDARFSLTVDGPANRGEALAPAIVGFEQRRTWRLLLVP